VCGNSNIWDLILHHLSYKKIWNHFKCAIENKSTTYGRFKARRKWSLSSILSQIEGKVKQIEYHIHLSVEIIKHPSNFLILCKKCHKEIGRYTWEDVSPERIKNQFEADVRQIIEKSRDRHKDFIKFTKLMDASTLTVAKQHDQHSQLWEEIEKVGLLDAIDHINILIKEIELNKKKRILSELTTQAGKMATASNIEQIITKNL